MGAGRWLVLWSLWAARWVPPAAPRVRLAQGELVGRVAPDGSHYQYLGIPYASSTHHYRFKAPGPPPKWEGVLEAIDEHVRCPQLFGAAVLGREDCLVLNVYAPVGAAAPLPVMVFVHGGGFKEGSGSRLLYGPDYIVARGVLLVTFNYRLGVQGFLCLGIKEAPGNAAMKDQVAALRWVRRNIRAFGGDPDNVTIFGESAGAASVSHHLVSPRSRNLFHKAILQSGSSVAGWAIQPYPLQVATHLAQALGYNVKEPLELYNIFMNETLSSLIKADIPKIKGQLKFMHLPYRPCIEREIKGAQPFLTESPYDIMKRGSYNKVPVIIGANDHEGYFFAAFEDEESLKNMRFEESLPPDLYFSTPEERRAAAERVRQLYMGDDEVSLDNIVKLSRLHGEPYFSYPALLETELLLETSDRPVYSYLFEYSGWRNFPKLISGLKFWMSEGAAHADDLFYLFSLFPVPSLFEHHMIDTMTSMWTNFAKHGSPGADWPAAERGAPLTLRLGARPRVAPLGRHRRTRMRLWRALYRRHRLQLSPDLTPPHVSANHSGR